VPLYNEVMKDLLTAFACVIGIAAFVVTPVVLSLRAASRRTRQETVEFLSVFARFAEAPNRTTQQELVDFLSRMSNLTPPAGFFDQSAPLFTRMVDAAATLPTLEWLFAKVTFAREDRAALLRWFGDLAFAAGRDAPAYARFSELLPRVKPPLTSVEARWFYDLSLRNVELLKGAPRAKALALQLGRSSYSAERADRRPTIYDEQAINNDISARCPPNTSA
jgi:hypothetical protein